MSETKVTVTQWDAAGRLYLRWTDPETGQRRSVSAGTRDWSVAERKAGKLEKELAEGTRASGARMPWHDFVDRYSKEVLSGLAENTRAQVATVVAHVDATIKPKRVGDITAARLSGFQAKLREGGRAEATIKSYLAHLVAMLKWGESVHILAKAPKRPKLQRARTAKVMKGRPITLEEFERMLAAVPKAIIPSYRPRKFKGPPKAKSPEEEARDAAAVASWRYYLEGLWWSGLRLAESLQLYWDDRPDKLSVDLSGRRPMLRIPAALEKGNRDRVLPIAPEFAEFLAETPQADRRGRVFKLLAAKGGASPKEIWVSAIVSRIGERAGVKVNVTTKRDRKTDKPTEVIKWASAHDLRRSFGERWSTRVMPQVLKELMRHEDINTTLRYYVGRNAETTADALWAAFEGVKARENGGGHDFGHDAEFRGETDAAKNDESPCVARAFV